MSTSAHYRLAGRLDGVTAAGHEQTLLALFTGPVISLTIGMADLEYVSSAGLRVLMAAAKAARARGGSVTLEAPQPPVLEVLRLSGFDTVFTITG